MIIKNLQILSLLLLSALVSISLSSCKKKTGCTDPYALNFDLEAEKDDGSCRYSNENVVVDNGLGTGTTTWTRDKVWILEGLVFVNPGQTLTIEAGTVIKGRPGQGSWASALVVARGGKIQAEGTPTRPIIFTAEQDDLDNPNDIPLGTKGLWGGLIVLGSAGLNSSPGESSVEGIPTTEPRGIYGSRTPNNDDNSGVLKYISIRYGGTDIGSGNEINGLTLGGVGSGTVLEHIEVLFNQDDGFEFFGGTVNAKWLVAAFCGDDAFDYDEGYRGKGQFWVSIGDANEGDRAGEHDGGTTPENGTPFATPIIYNATYIGRGATVDKRAVTFRDNAGGQYHNSIFYDFSKGIDIELLNDPDNSYARFKAGDLRLLNNVFWNVAGNQQLQIFTISPGTSVSTTALNDAAADFSMYFAAAGNQVLDPSFVGVTRNPDGRLNLNPQNSDVRIGARPASDPWFTPATYRGAFDGTDNWLQGWTGLHKLGYL